MHTKILVVCCSMLFIGCQRTSTVGGDVEVCLRVIYLRVRLSFLFLLLWGIFLLGVGFLFLLLWICVSDRTNAKNNALILLAP